MQLTIKVKLILVTLLIIDIENRRRLLSEVELETAILWQSLTDAGLTQQAQSIEEARSAYDLARANLEQVEDRYTGRRLETLQLIMSASTILLLVLVMTVMAINLTRPLQKTRDSFREPATSTGDLSRTIAVRSKDEVGELVAWFNQFIGKLRDLLVKVAGLVGKNHRLGERISLVSQSASTIVSNVVESVTRSRTEMARLDSEIERVTDSIDGMNESVQTLSLQVEEQGSAIQESTASIEAAHAGDAGRGFSVVAEEIRKLSDNTRNNADMIGKTLRTTTDKIQSATTVGQESEVALSTINQEVQEFSQTVQDRTSQIRTGIEVISESSRTMQQVSMQSLEITNRLADQGRRMNQVSTSMRAARTWISESTGPRRCLWVSRRWMRDTRNCSTRSTPSSVP
ncbi:MAG: methyl-accepting chemotaxis protein [Spirochaetota bacterium]